MTATVIGNVITGCTLECAHRRQLLAALNERSLSIRGLPFPRTQTTGDVRIDDLVVISALQLSVMHVKSSPIEVQRADVFFLRFPPDAYKYGQVRQYALESALVRTLVGVSGKLGPLLIAEFRSAYHDARRCCWSKSDVLATPPERAFLCQRNSWDRSVCLPRFQRHPRRRLVRTETVRYVMAATRWAVAVFKRVHCISVRTTSVDRVADWFSLHKRLVGQSVSKIISLQLERENSSAKCGIRSRVTLGPCCVIQGNAVAFS